MSVINGDKDTLKDAFNADLKYSQAERKDAENIEVGELQGQQNSWLGSAFYFGYLIANYPASLGFVEFPLAKYLSVSIVIWAIVLGCHAAANNFVGLCVLRVLLGITESTVSPGFNLLTGIWYKPSEHAWRHGIWFLGNGVANTFGGLFAYGVAHIEVSLRSPMESFLIPLAFGELDTILLGMPNGGFQIAAVIAATYTASKVRKSRLLIIIAGYFFALIGILLVKELLTSNKYGRLTPQDSPRKPPSTPSSSLDTVPATLADRNFSNRPKHQMTIRHKMYMDWENKRRDREQGVYINPEPRHVVDVDEADLTIERFAICHDVLAPYHLLTGGLATLRSFVAPSASKDFPIGISLSLDYMLVVQQNVDSKSLAITDLVPRSSAYITESEDFVTTASIETTQDWKNSPVHCLRKRRDEERGNRNSTWHERQAYGRNNAKALDYPPGTDIDSEQNLLLHFDYQNRLLEVSMNDVGTTITVVEGSFRIVGFGEAKQVASPKELENLGIRLKSLVNGGLSSPTCEPVQLSDFRRIIFSDRFVEGIEPKWVGAVGTAKRAKEYWVDPPVFETEEQIYDFEEGHDEL
ncbi:vitamin H transporter [Sclerotinia borealis F-4128]|uniref:Vitamin H transporter n=1 Tax=Sclerotinia borealis (strain F-4128) TaxID=1432307 RepID=W9CQ41_SCLBF|nr:vitamin H transporter [Sclerotinia borealis F-4128]